MPTRPLRLLTVALLGIIAVSAAAAAEPRVVLYTATAHPETWRYTTEKPAADWTRAGFDDRGWQDGKAGFGVVDRVTPITAIGTPWRSSDLWLRKPIAVEDLKSFQVVCLTIRHDEDVEVYLNGSPLFAESGFNTQWTAFDVTREFRKAVKQGENLLAVHVHQTVGGQYIDVGLEFDPKTPPPAARSPEELARLRASRWPADKAWRWYAGVGPICGCNFLPRTAVNSTEMWQKESFDPKTIDEELGWAQGDEHRHRPVTSNTDLATGAPTLWA